MDTISICSAIGNNAAFFRVSTTGNTITLADIAQALEERLAETEKTSCEYISIDIKRCQHV